jgi:hypothetical protein
MPSKKYTTANGKPFDMDSFRIQHEKIRAVGNMNVNARGDTIDSNNNIISDKTKRINTMYSKTTQNVTAAPKAQSVSKQQISPADMTDTELKEFGDDDPNPVK